MKEVDYRTNQAPKVPVLHEGDAARDLSAMKPGHLLTSLWQHQLGLQEPYDRHVHHTGVEHRHVAARRHREPDRGLSETKLKPEEGFSSALWKHFQSLQEPFDRHRDLTPRTKQDAKLSQIQLDSYARVQKAVCVASLPPLMTRSGSAPCVPMQQRDLKLGCNQAWMEALPTIAPLLVLPRKIYPAQGMLLSIQLKQSSLPSVGIPQREISSCHRRRQGHGMRIRRAMMSVRRIKSAVLCRRMKSIEPDIRPTYHRLDGTTEHFAEAPCTSLHAIVLLL